MQRKKEDIRHSATKSYYSCPVPGNLNTFAPCLIKADKSPYAAQTKPTFRYHMQDVLSLLRAGGDEEAAFAALDMALGSGKPPSAKLVQSLVQVGDPPQLGKP